MIPLRHVARIALAVVALAGCGGESDGNGRPGGAGGAAGDCAPPNRLVGDACREPGVQDNGCPAGTLGLEDGTCRPAGITPEMCGEGFVHDGDVGCEPILPPEPCPPGRMAVPGDAACRPVMPCALGTWGDIPVDGTTEHVDGSYTGGGSDGSGQKPWTTIGAAIAAAAPGAIVAIAAGSYAEDVEIEGKPVVVCGVCPDEVEIIGTGAALATILIREQASGTALRGVAVTGGAIGILLSGSQQVLVDEVWVHDNTGRGIDIEGVLGTTSCTVRGTLVEQNREFGVLVEGSEATVAASAVRGTESDPQGDFGRGIDIQGSTATGARATASLRGSLVEHNRENGMIVFGSDATVEATVVRGTQSDAQGLYGRGIGILADPDIRAPSNVSVRSSLVEQNREIGVFVMGSEATFEATTVRGTLPNANGLFGRGINIQVDLDTGARATATVRASVVEQNHDLGVRVASSDATLEAMVVRGTQLDAHGLFGRGIDIQYDLDIGTPSTAFVRGSRVEQNHEFGLVVISSEVTIDGCLVKATTPNDDARFGDGISAFSEVGPARLSVGSTRIEDSARAGVSSFGAFVSLASAVVQCASFDLEGQAYEGAPFTFEDLGGNACGCPSADGACLLETVGIEPPSPVTPIE